MSGYSFGNDIPSQMGNIRHGIEESVQCGIVMKRLEALDSALGKNDLSLWEWRLIHIDDMRFIRSRL